MPKNVPVESRVEQREGRSTAAADLKPLSPRHLAFVLPLVLMHLGCALVFLTGLSKPAAAILCGSSALQIFGVTAGYHRLLAHRSFKTSRAFQFVLAVLGVLAGQNGPLWWVGHHRHHHRHSDRDGDPHSPRHGFWWSHMGWLFSPGCVCVRHHLVADLVRYVELVRLERYSYAVNIGYALILYCLGEAWHTADPAACASGFQFVVCGVVISTVFSYHAIWSANSFCHCFGLRRYATADGSRNNFIVSLLTFGDGWHHNHHYCPSSARHGFRWWEIDINFAILSLLSWLGIVWDLRLAPEGARRPRAIPEGIPTPRPIAVLARKRGH
jgi:stearoyl-CoA desaturase (Delta-9 desaturase)